MSFFTIDKEKRLEEQDFSFLTQVNQVQKDVQDFKSHDSSLGILPSLEDFSSLQVIVIKDSPQWSDNDHALEKFQKSVNFKDDRHHVSFLWKEEIPDLPTNYELALGWLKSLLKRLSKDKDMLEQYNGIIQDQLLKGIIERVTSETVEGSTKHYIPHHPVVTPSKATMKVRIVHDASAKSRKNQKSLNECMDRGLVFLEALTSLLMRFRLYKIGITADIEKAFLNVGLGLGTMMKIQFFQTYLKLKYYTLSPSPLNALSNDTTPNPLASRLNKLQPFIDFCPDTSVVNGENWIFFKSVHN